MEKTARKQNSPDGTVGRELVKVANAEEPPVVVPVIVEVVEVQVPVGIVPVEVRHVAVAIDLGDGAMCYRPSMPPSLNH